MSTSKARIRLALIAGQLGLGGAEQQLYYLLCGLDRTRLQPAVITLGPCSDEYWATPIAALNVPITHVSPSLGRGGRLYKVATILRSLRAEVVHSWTFHANPYSAVAGRLAGVPVRLGSMRESYAGLPSNAWRWAGATGLDALVTNSNNNAEPLRARERMRTAIHVVPNGIALPNGVSDGERRKLKNELGLSADDTVIGTIGRIDQNKNHSMLLRAFARLAAKWPRLRLVIIGGGAEVSQVRAEAVQLGISSKLRLPGIIATAARYLPAFDVACLTSRTEGMSNLLMEASAAAVPVVSTRCGASDEVLAHGLTGFLIGQDDDAELASCVDRLVADPPAARQMGEAGRAKMRREFSIEAMVGRMADVYEEELARKR